MEIATKAFLYISLLCFAAPSTSLAEGNGATPQTPDSASTQGKPASEVCPHYAFTYNADRPEPSNRIPDMRRKHYKTFAKIMREAEVGNIDRAQEMLDDVLEQDLNSYEKANAHNLYGFTHYSEKNLDAAAQSYEAVLAQPDIPFNMRKNTVFTLSQLHVARKNLCEGLEELDRWFSMEQSPGPQHYQLIGQTYYLNGQMTIASKYLELVVADQDASRQSRIRSYRALATIYSQTESHEDAHRNAEATLGYLDELPPSDSLKSFKSLFHYYNAKALKGLGKLEQAYSSIVQAIDAAGDKADSSWITLRDELAQAIETG